MIDTVRSPALELVPAAPREPGPRARKLVFGYSGILKVRWALGIAFTLVGGVLAIVFGWGTPVDAAIDLGGSRRVQGRVVSAALDLHTRVNGRHPTDVRFDYDVDGRRFHAVSSALDRRLLALAPGTAVDVEVASSRPEWARMVGTTRSLFGYWGLLTTLFAWLGIAFWISAARARRQAVRAFTRGRAAVGKITFKGLARNYKLGNRHPFKVGWRFEADDGKSHDGSLSAMDASELAGVADAETLVVLYDPNDPRANTVWIEG